MTLLGLLILIIIIVVIFWVTGQITNPQVQMWVRIIAAVIIVIYLLSMIGAFDGMNLNAPIRRH